jgi:hypothetical protein
VERGRYHPVDTLKVSQRIEVLHIDRLMVDYVLIGRMPHL